VIQHERRWLRLQLALETVVVTDGTVIEASWCRGSPSA
jgi:hypothetical protein